MLKPRQVDCKACGDTATYTVSLNMRGRFGERRVSIPLCDACTLIGVQRQTLPSHHPVTLSRAKGFPPTTNHWFRTPDGDITVGCPACAALVSIDKPLMVDSTGKVEPSYICPNDCGLHVWMTLADWED